MYQVRGLVGLRNPHSICYANSFLQQLYHIDLFRRQLLGTDWRINPVNEEDLIYQLKRIFVNLRESR
jgi:ubiquitin C-terminal hydrolase